MFCQGESEKKTKGNSHSHLLLFDVILNCKTAGLKGLMSAFCPTLVSLFPPAAPKPEEFFLFDGRYRIISGLFSPALPTTLDRSPKYSDDPKQLFTSTQSSSTSDEEEVDELVELEV